MKPAPFEYHAPESLADVTALLAEHGDEAKVLAGGQSLVPMLALRLTRVRRTSSTSTGSTSCAASSARTARSRSGA